MNESNRHSLQEALRRMSSHQPREELWDHIAEDLDRPTPDEMHPETLRQGLNSLPRYRAPGWVWAGISHQLDRRVVRSGWLLGMAAALALLVGIGWAGWPHSPAPEPPLQASERRPLRELVVPEGEQADFLKHLSPQEQALLACLEQQPELSEEHQAQWQQLRTWALQADSLPAAADSLQAKRKALAAQLQAQFCD